MGNNFTIGENPVNLIITVGIICVILIASFIVFKYAQKDIFQDYDVGTDNNPNEDRVFYNQHRGQARNYQ